MLPLMQPLYRVGQKVQYSGKVASVVALSSDEQRVQVEYVGEDGKLVRWADLSEVSVMGEAKPAYTLEAQLAEAQKALAQAKADYVELAKAKAADEANLDYLRDQLKTSISDHVRQVKTDHETYMEMRGERDLLAEQLAQVLATKRLLEDKVKEFVAGPAPTTRIETVRKYDLTDAEFSRMLNDGWTVAYEHWNPVHIEGVIREYAVRFERVVALDATPEPEHETVELPSQPSMTFVFGGDSPVIIDGVHLYGAMGEEGSGFIRKPLTVTPSENGMPSQAGKPLSKRMASLLADKPLSKRMASLLADKPHIQHIAVHGVDDYIQLMNEVAMTRAREALAAARTRHRTFPMLGAVAQEGAVQ